METASVLYRGHFRILGFLFIDFNRIFLPLVSDSINTNQDNTISARTHFL